MQAVFASLQHMNGVFDGGGTWFWPVAVVLHVAFWALVIWLIVRVTRPWIRSRQPNGPERILAERFAEGAIGEDDYRQRLEVIRGSQEAR